MRHHKSSRTRIADGQGNQARPVDLITPPALLDCDREHAFAS